MTVVDYERRERTFHRETRLPLQLGRISAELVMGSKHDGKIGFKESDLIGSATEMTTYSYA